MRRVLLSFLWVGFISLAAARSFTVVAYNVENLFDLDGQAGFEEYQPSRYTPQQALTKLQNIARVVAEFEDGRGPDVLMLCELEVDQTPGRGPTDYDAWLATWSAVPLTELLGRRFNAEIADWSAEMLLMKALYDQGVRGYRIVVADNRSAVGTGRRLEQKNALLTRFPVKASRSHPITDARAILEVQLEVDGAPLHVFVNHWKSGASDALTEPTRVANAQTLRTRLDEILRLDSHADIVLGGDFNSQYNQRQRYPAMTRTGMNDVLGAQGNELATRSSPHGLYNLWYELPVTERGSDTFRGEWGTLIHLIVSRGLYDFRGVQYVDNSFQVAKFSGLNADAKGLPLRWNPDAPHGSGFSDHFPVAAKFVRVSENRTDRYLDLANGGSVEGKSPANSTKIDFKRLDVEKIAIRPERGAVIRVETNKGKIYRVEGRVASGPRLAVEFHGDVYDIWSYDESLRNRLRRDYAAGSTLRLFGELSQFRGRWQFVVQDPSWVR